MREIVAIFLVAAAPAASAHIPLLNFAHNVTEQVSGLSFYDRHWPVCLIAPYAVREHGLRASIAKIPVATSYHRHVSPLHF